MTLYTRLEPAMLYLLQIQTGCDCQLCLYVLYHSIGLIGIIRVSKLMGGVPILTAEYHTQYIWLILLTKISECSDMYYTMGP